MVLRDLPDGVSSDGEEVEGYFAEQASSVEDLSMENTPSQTPRSRQAIEVSESKSGIGWKFANQGLSLLSLSFDESSTISQDPRFGNATFARQLYIHSLTYLLRALPSDLSTEEQLSVRNALPAGLVEPPQPERNTALPASSSYSQNPPSLLHRTLASTIVQMFILFQFILPYLKYLLTSAYQYEREHKICEKVLSQSIDTVDVLGKQSLSVTSAIYGMGDGKVGQAIMDAATWFVEGVTGGIHDGLGEGMVIMGAKRSVGERR